ncbi:hypothetical protein PTKIN_Ptkin06aG0198500 [Pterospermum kingtungense]
MEPIATGAAANLSAEAAKGIFEEVKRHVRYVTKHKKMVEKFDEKMELLIAKRKSVQQEVDAAQRNVEKIKADVEVWSKQVDKKIDEGEKKVKDLKEKAKAKCFIGLCPNIKSRYQLSRKAEEDVAAVDELLQQSRFDRVAIRDVPRAPSSAAPKNFKAFGSRKKVFDEIMEALKDSTISMIGVYGVGGVGKTTLVNEVARQVQELKLFDPVVKAKVTQNPKIEEIQDQIADSLGLKLEAKSVQVRACRLSERLKKEKKILIVLDDIWAALDLEEVGIPFGDQRKGGLDGEEGIRKILLTSRNQNVLTNEMDAKKTVEISLVKEEEAWDLFQEMAAGSNFENPKLPSEATKVVKRCAGLPLAIVTVAKALKNKDLHEWRDACRQLQRPSPTNFTGVPGPLYAAIELSYNHLENEELKQTFLLSCLLGYGVPINVFSTCAMGLHLFDGVSTLEETRNRVLTIVSNLKACCLFIDGYDKNRIAMHDFVRAVALAIASRDNHAFASKHWDDSGDWPDEETVVKLKMINLWFASVKKLPHKLECPQLSLLAMTSSKDYYLEIPTSFFEKMKNIKVLYLFQMGFSSPSSISLLTSLQTLWLERCKLGHLVDFGKLKNLQILTLIGSDIEMLPKETGQLSMLRLLDLSYCTKLRIISPGVLSSLSRLEELYMFGIIFPWNQQSNAHLDELKHLSCLTLLSIQILDAKLVPEDLFSEKLQRYWILIGSEWGGIDNFECPRTLKLRVDTSIDHLDNGFKRLLKKAEALYLENLEGVRIVLKQVGSRDCFLNLKHLHIRNASEIQYIMKDNEAADKVAFRELRSMRLENLPHLISFCSSRNRTEPDGSNSVPQHDELPLFGEQMELPCLENLRLSSINVGRIWHNRPFSTQANLTSLIIQGCGNLKYILSSSMAKRLVHLKSFEIVDCKSLREIIFAEDIQEEENEVTISFPQLSTLKMKNLLHLVGFCSENHKISFPFLWALEIEQCPKFNGFVYKSTTEENQPQFMQAVFDEKVVCPNLVNLRLSSIKVERIWHDQLPDVSCYVQKLGWLSVAGCHNLKCIFSSSMMPLLMELHTILIEDCANVEVIFIEEAAADEYTILPKLRVLRMKNLPKLMTFCHGSYLEFLSLRFLDVWNCPTFRTFIFDSKNAQGNNSSQIDFPPLFNEKVAFPQLEQLRIERLGNCRKIWHNLFIGDSLSKLRRLYVLDCHGLVNIFPVKMIKRLQNLQVLQICYCGSLEEIFESKVLDANGIDASMTAMQSIVEETITNFIFPKLTYLELRLPRLKSFYSRLHTTEWPSLKKMCLYGCDMVEIFASDSLSFGKSTNLQPLFWVNEVTFPNLEELKLEWNDILRTIWDGPLRADVFIKLRVLKLKRFPDMSANIFPHCFIQSLPNLEKLVVSDSPFSQVFNLEGSDGNEIDALALASLNELRLAKLPQLTHLLKEDYILSEAFRKVKTLAVLHCGKLKNLVPSWVSFENLTSLEVSDCDGLVNLVSCSTAKSLVQLARMSITDCCMIEEIIGGYRGDEVKDCIVFSQLKYLQLSCLPNLSSFCIRDHIFEFPALEKVIVRGCPKMRIFCLGDLSTPQLQKVTLTEDENDDKDDFTWQWEGNLNATVKWLFDKKVGYCGLEHLKLFGSSEMLEIWRRNPQGMLDFKSLKSLEVYDCSSLKFLFTSSTALDLAQLGEIKAKNCTVIENIILDEGAPEEELVKNKIVFPLLRSIVLESCADLASFYHGSKILEFPSLKIVEVVDCPQMFAFASTFSRQQRIEFIDDGENETRLSKVAEDVYAAAFFNSTVVCINLEDLRLSSINTRRIWDEQLPETSCYVQNLTRLTVERCHSLRCLFSFSIKQLCSQLTKLVIEDCRSVEEVIFIEERLAEEDMSQIFPKLESLALLDLPKLVRFCNGSYCEFPMLTKLAIMNCPTLETFISDSIVADKTHNCQKGEGNSSDIDFLPLFNEKVAFPQIEKLILISVGSCKMIWHNHLKGDSFSKLNLLWVKDCNRLVNVFPLNMSERLQNLEEFRVNSCVLLEEIFEPQALNAHQLPRVTGIQSIKEETSINFVFPRLTYLKFYKLPRLKSFYFRRHTTEWPSLKKMWLYGCDMVEIFASERLSFGELTNKRPLFWMNQVTFPNLQKLKLEGNCILGRIWHGHLQADVFSKLRVLQNVTTLKVSRCHGFVNLMACCTAKSLVQLTRMSITDCDMIEEIIGGEGDEVKGYIVFTQLRYLQLSCLPSLSAFCLRDHEFKFPALEKIIVRECTKMRIFCQGDLSTPQLQKVLFIEDEEEHKDPKDYEDEDEYEDEDQNEGEDEDEDKDPEDQEDEDQDQDKDKDEGEDEDKDKGEDENENELTWQWEGNLNATIKWLFDKMAQFNGLKSEGLVATYSKSDAFPFVTHLVSMLKTQNALNSKQVMSFLGLKMVELLPSPSPCISIYNSLKLFQC